MPRDDTYEDDARHSDEVAELERLLADAQSENEVLRQQIAEAWSAHGELQQNFELMAFANSDGKVALAKADERIRELEQEIDTHAGECHPQIESLEQQLKAAQERLAEAELFMNKWKNRPPTNWHEGNEMRQQFEEYFAKHSNPSTACKHLHLDMDGICHGCGEDRRGG